MLLVIAVLMVPCGTASGQITFSIEVAPPVAAGDDATVSFFGTSATTGGQLVNGFNLPVDIGGDGAGLANGLSIGVGALANPIASTASLTTGGPQNDMFGTDTIVNIGGGPSFTVDDTPTLLFDLVISTDAATPVGTFPIQLVNNPFFSVTGGDGITPLTGSSVIAPGGGSIEIAAVPEPSTASLLGLVALAGLAMRRRQ